MNFIIFSLSFFTINNLIIQHNTCIFPFYYSKNHKIRDITYYLFYVSIIMSISSIILYCFFLLLQYGSIPWMRGLFFGGIFLLLHYSMKQIIIRFSHIKSMLFLYNKQDICTVLLPIYMLIISFTWIFIQSKLSIFFIIPSILVNVISIWVTWNILIYIKNYMILEDIPYPFQGKFIMYINTGLLSFIGYLLYQYFTPLAL